MFRRAIFYSATARVVAGKQQQRYMANILTGFEAKFASLQQAAREEAGRKEMKPSIPRGS